MTTRVEIERAISRAMRGDRHRFRRRLRSIADRKAPESLAGLAAAVEKSILLREQRRGGVPHVRYEDALPISAQRAEIAAAIREHQVVIVCGETGSGKSTQLPKICLEMGRGIEGLIGHTQPRRIAARSVAARIAEELGTPLGQQVGFKVRFAEALSAQTYIKLMTDGILLAETQGDPYFDQYDTIILDEAHERSLNIDFLMGYLKRLLPKRPDLKLIITSATIDAARFSSHFATSGGPAPVVEVPGRTYPVELRWRPAMADEEVGEPDFQQAVLSAVEEVAAIDRGDILIFMPTERHIHETSKMLRGRPIPGDPNGNETEILPLYARLSMGEQQKVFHPGSKRRIVIATNVAESSLTVPRVRYVIDPGTARVSRYSPRTKTQRLPIEAISRASADQRKGRCGRVGPGICVRLFSEEDYLRRDAFTVPEIQRTNLASVILQTKALRLGAIERFPFLDPPKPDAIRDGYRTLWELGALDAKRELTEIGRQLSRLPIDPRFGRMIIAAGEEGCLHEVLIIAAALSVQDPRERPLEKQEAADACHALRADEQSDFVAYLKLWDFYHKLKAELSQNQLRKACKQNFLSYNRMREWLDVHRELMELVRQAGLSPEESNKAPRKARRVKQGHTERQQFDQIHRAVLPGLLSNVALRGDGYEYAVAGGGKGHVWPGSGLFEQKPKWLVAAELVETTRRYMRTCGRIDPRWIESMAGHLVKRSYHGVHWEAAHASAMALERVTLFGLTIIPGRRVHYGPIDPETSRHLLIENGLVEGRIEPKPAFLQDNEALVEDLERLQAKLRRRDLLVGDFSRYEFYDRRVPADVYDGNSLTRWIRRNPNALTMNRSDLLREDVGDLGEDRFPDSLQVDHLTLPLDYEYDPGSPKDGLTINVPIEVLNQVASEPLGWLVPGLIEEKVLALIRSLPKALRTHFVPAPGTAKQVAPLLRFGEGELRVAVAAALSRLAGIPVPSDAFQEDRLPPELRMSIRVNDAEGRSLIAGRDLDAIRTELGRQAAESFSKLDDPQWNRDGLTEWDFGDLPAELEMSHGRLTVKAYPALIDCEGSVSLRLVDSPARAEQETYFGLRRLCFLAAKKELRTQIDWLPNFRRMDVYASTLPGLDLRKQLAELLADRAMVFGQSVPGSRMEFEQLVAAGRERIAWAVQELAGVVGSIFEGYHQTRLAMDQLASRANKAAIPGVELKLGGRAVNLRAVPKTLPVRSPQGPAETPRWQYVIDDIGEQIAQLMDPKTFSKTPWEWLRQYPRYFRAICARLENLPAGLPRDWEKFQEFQPRWQLFHEHWQHLQRQGSISPEAVHLRWMLEEYRVSLFAQKLGTSIPISPKRLDQQWAKLQT